MGKLGKGKAKERLVSDTDLFAFDDAGNEQLRSQLLSGTHDAPAAAHPRRGSGKPLKSTEILAMRSKVPARTSKVQPGVMVQHMKQRERRMKITPELKKRLRSMVKHASTSDRGLWDVTSHSDRSALDLSSAVAGSGSQNLWDTQANAVASTSKAIVPAAVEELSLSKPAVKMPRTLRSHGLLDSAAPSAVPLPHPGESYNPTLSDHQTLLAQQQTEAEAEEAARQAARAVKDSITSNAKGGSTWDTGYAEEVGSGDEAEELISVAEGSAALKKAPRRKTDKAKARRKENKAMEARTKAQSKITKAQRQALGTLRDISDNLDGTNAVSLADLHKRKAALAKRISAQGIAGMRSGPGRAPMIRQNYLLSDELPESLRQLKTDGDLWQDWLDSSRRRARVQTERGTFGRMMKVKGRNLKSVEKATWRNFDRA